MAYKRHRSKQERFKIKQWYAHNGNRQRAQSQQYTLDLKGVEDRILAYMTSDQCTDYKASGTITGRFPENPPFQELKTMHKPSSQSTHSIQVKFSQDMPSNRVGGALYLYRCTDPNIKVGDLVVIDSGGWCFAKVENVWYNTIIHGAFKYIVDRVDVEAYRGISKRQEEIFELQQKQRKLESELHDIRTHLERMGEL